MKMLVLIFSFLASSIALACSPDRLCSGDRIIDSSENVGTVKEVFDNGQALVDFDRYSATNVRQVNSLGKGVKCFQRICVGDRIVDSSGNVGTVKEVFDNGQALVDFDGYSATNVRQVNSLGKSYRCTQTFKPLI